MKWLILAALLAVIVIAAVQTVRRFRKGGGCCGVHETVKLHPVTDKNPSHYPYRAEAEIGGMTCANCAIRVANALNKLDGVWAEVSFDRKSCIVRSRQNIDESAIRNAVLDAGYVVMKYKETE